MTLFEDIASTVEQFHDKLMTENDLVSYFERLSPDDCNKFKIHDASFTEFLFTWREKRQDTVPEPVIQHEEEDTCWAIALFRGQNALVRINQSSRAHVTLEMLLDGVVCRSESLAVDSLEDVVPFMESSSAVRKMIVHHRPRGFNQTEQEQFESLIENLLVKGPVVVAFDVFSSYDEFTAASGQGVYSPTDLDCEMRLCHRSTRHCVVLYGKGVEVKGQVIQEFWEALESCGDKFGDAGFVRLARGKCLLREVVELKV